MATRETRLRRLLLTVLDWTGAVVFGASLTYGAYTVQPWLAALVAGLLLILSAWLLEHRG